MKPIPLGIACLLLANCASMVGKTKKVSPVSITSNPAGCKVCVKKPDGTVVHRGTTPTSVVLASGAGYFKPASYAIEFTHKGMAAQTITVRAGLNGWYFGNLVLPGGSVGMLIVDPSTGAMWKMKSKVHADLAPLAVVDAGNQRRLQIIDRTTLPPHFDSELIALR